MQSVALPTNQWKRGLVKKNTNDIQKLFHDLVDFFGGKKESHAEQRSLALSLLSPHV